MSMNEVSIDKHTLSVTNDICWFSEEKTWKQLDPQEGKRDGVNGHISKRENLHWKGKIALLRERSI